MASNNEHEKRENLSDYKPAVSADLCNLHSGRKSIWTTIKEVTQRMLAFADKSEDAKVNSNSTNNANTRANIEQSSEYFHSDSLNLNVNHKMLSNKKENLAEQHVQLLLPNQVLKSGSNNIACKATHNVKHSKETQTISTDKAILLIKEDIKNLCTKNTSLAQSKCWHDFETWSFKSKEFANRKYKIIDCCGFPVLHLHSVPKVLGSFISEMIFHVLTARFYELPPAEKVTQHTVESWLTLELNCVIHLTSKVPSDFSNYLHETYFQFTPTNFICKLCMNGSMIVDHSFAAPKGMSLLFQYNANDDSTDDYVAFSCKLIKKMLALESQKMLLDYRKLVEVFFKHAPAVCHAVGKCLVDLGRQAQLLFLNLDNNCFLSSFDSRNTWSTEETKLGNFLVNEATNTTTAFLPYSIFTRKTVLYLLVILKSHVATCYSGLWGTQRICYRDYPRITQLFAHTVFSLYKSGDLKDTMAELSFNIIWSKMKDKFLEAFILDACENIKDCAKWKTIVGLMLKCKDIDLYDEMKIKQNICTNYKAHILHSKILNFAEKSKPASGGSHTNSANNNAIEQNFQSNQQLKNESQVVRSQRIENFKQFLRPNTFNLPILPRPTLVEPISAPNPKKVSSKTNLSSFPAEVKLMPKSLPLSNCEFYNGKHKIAKSLNLENECQNLSKNIAASLPAYNRDKNQTYTHITNRWFSSPVLKNITPLPSIANSKKLGLTADENTLTESCESDSLSESTKSKSVQNITQKILTDSCRPSCGDCGGATLPIPKMIPRTPKSTIQYDIESVTNKKMENLQLSSPTFKLPAKEASMSLPVEKDANDLCGEPFHPKTVVACNLDEHSKHISKCPKTVLNSGTPNLLNNHNSTAIKISNSLPATPTNKINAIQSDLKMVLNCDKNDSCQNNSQEDFENNKFSIEQIQKIDNKIIGSCNGLIKSSDSTEAFKDEKVGQPIGTTANKENLKNTSQVKIKQTEQNHDKLEKIAIVENENKNNSLVPHKISSLHADDNTLASKKPRRRKKRNKNRFVVAPDYLKVTQQTGFDEFQKMSSDIKFDGFPEQKEQVGITSTCLKKQLEKQKDSVSVGSVNTTIDKEINLTDSDANSVSIPPTSQLDTCISVDNGSDGNSNVASNDGKIIEKSTLTDNFQTVSCYEVQNRNEIATSTSSISGIASKSSHDLQSPSRETFTTLTDNSRNKCFKKRRPKTSLKSTKRKSKLVKSIEKYNIIGSSTVVESSIQPSSHHTIGFANSQKANRNLPQAVTNSKTMSNIKINTLNDGRLITSEQPKTQPFASDESELNSSRNFASNHYDTNLTSLVEHDTFKDILQPNNYDKDSTYTDQKIVAIAKLDHSESELTTSSICSVHIQPPEPIVQSKTNQAIPNQINMNKKVETLPCNQHLNDLSVVNANTDKINSDKNISVSKRFYSQFIPSNKIINSKNGSQLLIQPIGLTLDFCSQGDIINSFSTLDVSDSFDETLQSNETFCSPVNKTELLEYCSEKQLIGEHLYNSLNEGEDENSSQFNRNNSLPTSLQQPSFYDPYVKTLSSFQSDSETSLELSCDLLDSRISKTNINMWTNKYIRRLERNPLDELIAQQNATVCGDIYEPFMVVPTKDADFTHNKKELTQEADTGIPKYPELDEYCHKKVKICVGEYTFNISTNMRVGSSSRDGVDVFHGVHQSSGIAVAAKYCLRHTLLDLAQILGPINKSNLVRLLDISVHNPRSLVLIMELCDCNLKSFIVSDAFLKSEDAIKTRMCHELLSGLNVLHANNIIHGNLKPENILIGKDSILKIADYPVVSNWSGFMNQLPCRNSDRLCWEATEVKKRLNNSSAHKSDIQVAGMLLHYIMCNGLHPFGKRNSTVISIDSNIRAGQYAIQTENIEARHLLSWMVLAEPNARKDTNICLTHPYFWSRKKQVQFLAAVGRQPEIRSGFKTNVLDQINQLGQRIEFNSWKEKVDVGAFARESEYDNTLCSLLKFISDICDITMPSDLLGTIGHPHDYISAKFSCCVLPIYDIVIKSPLCLKPQVEDVIHMSAKSYNAF